MATAKNKEVIQSYVLTTAKYNFNVHEKRILYRLVDLAQAKLEGQKLKGKIEHNFEDFTKVTMPISLLLKNETDKNHSVVKKALEGLQNKQIIYEDEDIWTSIPVIIAPVINKRSNYVSCSIHSSIWDAILDFSKGFRKIELITAMKFESVYTMRFYELMSGKTEPITYTIQFLKELFQIEEKYSRINDFMKKVVVAAKTELDKHSPYSFEFEVNKEGRKFHSITFKPIFIRENMDDELEKRKLLKKQSISWELGKEFSNYLKYAYDFEEAEIKRNIELLGRAQKEIEDPIGFLSRVKENAFRAKNRKGYLINAIKSELK